MVRTDKEMAVALLSAYTATHTLDTSRKQGSGLIKSEKVTRPKITQSMRVEAWSSSQITWKPYKTGTGIPKEEGSLQLLACGDVDPREQPSRTDPISAPQPEARREESIRRRTAIPVAKGARCSEKLSTPQEPDELSQVSLAKAQGKAATYKRQVRDVQERGREGGEPVNATNPPGQRVLGNVPADADNGKESLNGKLGVECSPKDAVSTMVQKEGARKTLVLEAVWRLAVISIAMGVRRSETTNTGQVYGEPPRAFLAKVQGKAATCEGKTKCAEDCCREKGNPVDFMNMGVEYVPVNGLGDAETRRKVLGWEPPDECTLTDAIALEQKETARDAFKAGATARKTGYKKQQASTGTADEAKLHKIAKCEGCAAPFSQYARGKSRQKRETKEPRAETSRDKTVRTEKASTLCVSNNRSIPYKGMGATRRRSKCRKHTQGKNSEVPRSSSNETGVAQPREEAALYHHAGDPISGWTKKRIRQQPALQPWIRPCQVAYSRSNVQTPKVALVMVDGSADTRAQARLWSAADFHRSDYKERDLVRVKQQVVATSGQLIEILEAISPTAQANSVEMTLMVWVIPEI